MYSILFSILGGVAALTFFWFNGEIPKGCQKTVTDTQFSADHPKLTKLCSLVL